MNNIIIIIIIFASVSLLGYFFMRGASDYTCHSHNKDVTTCMADHWRSAHCYQVFLDDKKLKCEKE